MTVTRRRPSSASSMPAARFAVECIALQRSGIVRQRIVSASLRRKASRYAPGDGVEVAVTPAGAEQRVELRVGLDVPVIDELPAARR